MWTEDYKRDKHFFHGNASMLEGILVVIHKLMVIVRIHQEVIICCKYKGRTDMGFGQMDLAGTLDLKNLLDLIVQVLPLFISQVR